MHVELDVLDPNRLREAEPLAQNRRDETLRRHVQRSAFTVNPAASAKRPILNMSLRMQPPLTGESSDHSTYAAGVAHYLFNLVSAEAAQRSALRERAAGFLRVRMWGVDADEPHGAALAAGDLVLIYLGAPERTFIGRAELASRVHDWTPSEAQLYPGDSPGGVLLAQVEEWDPPVPMSAVVSQIEPIGNARADFERGVVRITANEYETALAVEAARATSTA